ncbi:amidase [Microbacterium resistens]|uniref:amidase n=1 Tax=Microbacterium resistens TaxID=156977 RepID=UPI000829726B|nr:amidase family protein [Microbacterium resistens]
MDARASDEIVRLSAREQARRIRVGAVSVREIVEAHLDRIDRVNPAVNALVTVDHEGALSRAEELDRGGQEGVLRGLPVAIKDLARTKGMRTTLGYTGFADNVPDADDLQVARIRDAGAVLVGKSNTPAFAAGSHTVNALFGATRNPHALDRSAGGSSGGAAAALAAHLVPLADGSDMGGSLRNPASFCGVVGLRPTPGVIPTRDAPNAFNPLITTGPMARDVRDLALLLRAEAGSYGAEPRGVDLTGSALEDVRPIGAGGLRVAYAPTLGGRIPVDDEVRAVLDRVAARLDDAGAVIEADCPDLDGADEAFRTIRQSEAAAALEGIARTAPERLPDFLLDEVRRGQARTAADVARAYAETTRLLRAAESFFDGYDLVLAPTAQVPPFPVEQDWVHEVAGVPQGDYLEWMQAAYLFTPLGIPGISIPAGWSAEGTPIGVQLLARARQDVALVRMAAGIEDVLAVPIRDLFATG